MESVQRCIGHERKLGMHRTAQIPISLSRFLRAIGSLIYTVCIAPIMLLGGSRMTCMMLHVFPALDLTIQILQNISQPQIQDLHDLRVDRDLSNL